MERRQAGTLPPSQEFSLPPDPSTIGTLFLALTDRCNLSCQHCSFNAAPRRHGEALDWPLFCRLVEEGYLLGARHFVLSGGEPTLHSRLVDMATTVLERAPDTLLSISSNGFAFPARVVNVLRRYRSRAAVQLSVDGDAATHDRLRGRKGSHQHAFATLQELREVRINVSAAFTVCHDNYDTLPTTLEALAAIGVPMRVGPLYPVGRGKTLRGIDPPEIFKLMDFVRVGRSLGVSIDTNLPATVDPEALTRIGDHPACGWGRHLLGVHPDGSVWLCVNTPRVDAAYGGSLKRETLARILADPQRGVTQARGLRTVDLKGACAICAARDVCGGACRTLALEHFGDLLAPFPLCQELYDLGLIDPAAVSTDG